MRPAFCPAPIPRGRRGGAGRELRARGDAEPQTKIPTGIAITLKLNNANTNSQTVPI